MIDTNKLREVEEWCNQYVTFNGKVEINADFGEKMALLPIRVIQQKLEEQELRHKEELEELLNNEEEISIEKNGVHKETFRFVRSEIISSHIK